MKIAWVLGSGGLLGSALCRVLRHQETILFSPKTRFLWLGGPVLFGQMRDAVQAFSAQVNEADEWEIYWAAGIGTMSSSQDSLAPETQALAEMLGLLASDPRLMKAYGSFAFASSAGAIYAGSSDDIMTEKTSPLPTTFYAHEKLKQEELISTFSAAHDRTSTRIARLSTIYGPGQAAGKPQGLLTHMARRILINQPIQIYVPYDTIRDYIAVDDAASEIIRTVRINDKTLRVLTKIVASEHPTTIAEIISVFKRITRRAPRVVTSASRLSKLYARRVQFRSIVLPEFGKLPQKSLAVGIAQLMTAERAAFVLRK